MNYELHITKDRFHLVSEEGFPEDMTECCVLYKVKDEVSFAIMYYSEEDKNFYVNNGFGGLSLDEDECFAWAEITEDILKEVK